MTRESPSLENDSSSNRYSLVLLRRSQDSTWLGKVLEGPLAFAEEERLRVLSQSTPALVASGMTLQDAMLGQFELACCNSVAVLVRDEVYHHAEEVYLRWLWAVTMQSREFETIGVSLSWLPCDFEGERFARQFLHKSAVELSIRPEQPPLEIRVMRKKARAMQDWAQKIGVRLTIQES